MVLLVQLQGLGPAEIQSRSRHRQKAARGDGSRIHLRKPLCPELQGLLHGRLRPLLSRQVKVAVIGHIKHCIPVKNTLVSNSQTPLGQGIGHLHPELGDQQHRSARVLSLQGRRTARSAAADD